MASEADSLPTPMRDARGLHMPYLPGLDGLRALAVLAVLLYHGAGQGFPGGFLGVEVFFVLSGYLITVLLLMEWHRRGTLDVRAFWLRRARRLLPALFLILVVTLAYAVVFLPNEVAGLRGDALAAFAYVTNWYLIFKHTSYFESVGRPSLLQHLWSLAVEEQFYLLWPLMLGLAMRRLPRRAALVAVLVCAAASTALMAALYHPAVDPSRVYYGTDTRAAGLLIGAALAFVWAPGVLPRAEKLRGVPAPIAWLEEAAAAPIVLDAIGFAALVALVVCFLRLGEFQPFLYRGGFAGVSLVTAAIIAVVVHRRAQLVPRLLGAPPLRWAGTRSYGIYLWHWPIFMVTRPHLDLPFDGLPVLALRFVATGVLAELSYRCVEMPIRRGALERTRRTWRRSRGAWRRQLRVRWGTAGGAVAAVVALLGVMVARAEPPPPPAYLAVPAVHTSAQTKLAGTTVSVAATPSATPIIVAGPVALPTLPPFPTATIAPTATPIPAHRITAVGDSVMVGAAPNLERAIGDIDIDAEQGLQAGTAIDILRARRTANQLGKVVIVHIGDNGRFTGGQFDEMMRVLAETPRVIVVNVKVPRAWEAENNRVLADGVRRYPNTVLADWRGASVNRPELFYDDGIHLRPEGARVYTDLIASQLAAG